MNTEEMSKSSEDVVGREPETGDGSLLGVRKMSGHKRSRSEGSSTTTAVLVSQSERDEGPRAAARREKEMSPPYLPRPRNGRFIRRV